MIQKFVEALKNGKILAVDWQEIDEMLGEDLNREIKCSICDDGNCFPPSPVETHDLREEDVMEVIRQAEIRWASFDYVNGTPLQVQDAVLCGKKALGGTVAGKPQRVNSAPI